NMRLPFAEKEMANIEQKLNSLIDNLEQVMKYNDPSIFNNKLIEKFERTVEHETSYLSPEIWHASTGCSIWSKNKDQFYGDLIVDQLLSHLFESGPCNNCQGEDKFYLAYKDRQKEKRFIYTYEYNNRLSACVNFKSCTDFQTSSLLTKFYPNKFFQAVWVGIHQEKFYAFQSQLLAIKFDQQADLKSFWSSAEERLKIKSEMEQGLSNLIRRIWFNEGGQNYYSYVMVKNNTIVILDPSTLYWEKWGNNKRILRILNNYF
ncbi:MAG: hypothetical protein MUO85_06040, partial [candidate division Zixibacteria bacterium]|nr:hypothetical protein [candidate division Zixibacteria bacterium]